MTLQQDVQDKLFLENDELRNMLLNFVIEVDDNKRSIKKIKEELLDDVRELIMEELGE